MTPAFTVILPHKRNPGNDAALNVCLQCLVENTASDYHLIMDAATDAPLYPRINRMVEQARTECVVYLCSDMFLSKAWDVPMLALWNTDTIVTNIVVEPGVMGISPKNVGWDFGRRPETFRRHDFESWAAQADAPVPDGEGWLAPYMISRQAFLDFGGLQTGLAPDHQGFTHADQLFFAAWKDMGRRIIQARSYTYHLQRYSEVDEQVKEARG